MFCLVALSTIQFSRAQAVPAWAPDTTYAIGDMVTYGGVTYTAIQAETSEPGWEPPNTPALWQPTNTGGAQSCAAAPPAPSNAASSNLSSSGVTISWTAPAAPANCTITGYTVLSGGASVGITTGTSLAVTGLAASTGYSFTVKASDIAGTSAASNTVTVTTPASGSSGGAACAPAWISTTAYTAGQKVTEGGIVYTANWWTQGNDPATNSGVTGSGKPWAINGACSACTTIPGVPTGLAAGTPGGFSVPLSWNAAAVASNCAITGYTVYENGHSIGTATGTAFTATGLTPDTQYSFAVAASDPAGSSAPSGTISSTTGAASSGGGSSAGYAPYIDMSLTPDEQLLTIQQQSNIKTFTLAFIVGTGSCSASWGGIGPISNDSLPNGTTILSLVQGVRAAGGDVIISFGGALGQELALDCSDAASLQAAYQSVINKYTVNKIDIDIEGGAVSDQASITRRDQALKALKAANPGLVVSYTLPVLPTGLVDTGVNILTSAKADGLALDVVNVMAMDYGSSQDNGAQMGLDATDAAVATESQIQAAGLSATVGVTPMVGVNDTNTEVFQLSDAQTLLNFAQSHSYITRLSIWSVGRDNGGCAGQDFASATCSGLAQNNYQFSSIFEAFQ
ncbi:MAG: carbohydrate-binding protein [Aliidongia sp.]